MNSFLAAIQLLTAIPIRRKFNAGETTNSPAFFPLVGLFIGALLAGLSWLLRLILPPNVVNALIITVLVIITGSLHLDGLSDTCDGLGGNRTPEERLRIMDDSHTGSFGTVGAILILLIKYAALINLPREQSFLTLIVMTTVGRWAMTYAIYHYPYAKNAGMGKYFKENITHLQIIIASIIMLVVAVGLLRIAGLAAVLFSWLVVTAVGKYLSKQLGGLTGDCYGALNEISEVSVILIVNLLVFKQWLWIG